MLHRDGTKVQQGQNRKPLQLRDKSPNFRQAPSKYTRETIQISLVRSFTTSEATTAGQTQASSSGQSMKFSESRESVKDSNTSYSSSDEPQSSTASEEESFSSENSEYGDESEEYVRPEYRREEYSRESPSPTDPSREINNIVYDSSRRTTEFTGYSTSKTEMPYHSVNKRLSTDDTSSRKSKPSSNETTYMSNTNGSVSFNSTSKSFSNQDESTSTFHPKELNILETINEDEYIRAHLTLPTNKVVSILMKKDENLGEFLTMSQESNESDTGSSPGNGHNVKRPLIDKRSRHKSQTPSPTRERIFATSKSVNPKQKLLEHLDFLLRKANPTNFNDILEESIEEQMTKLNSSVSTKQNEKMKQGTEQMLAMTKEDGMQCPFGIGVNTLQTVARIQSQHVSFNLPTLPKLNQNSMFFKLDAQATRPNNSKGKSIQSFRKHRSYRLRKMPNKAMKYNSSVRCPKFISFEPVERRKETETPKIAAKKVKQPSKVICPPVKHRMVDKANSPMELSTAVVNVPDKNKIRFSNSKPESSKRVNFSMPCSPRELENQTVDSPVVDDIPYVSNKVGNSLRDSIERQIQRRLQNKITNKEPQIQSVDEPNLKVELTSPAGRTKTFVRFYESAKLPDAESIKYNFQNIRKKFESSSRDPSDKAPCNAGAPYNIPNLHKNFSSNSKLIKSICQDRRMQHYESQRSSRADLEYDNGKQRKDKPNEAFNNLVEEIVNKVEKAKSGKTVKARPRSKRTEQDPGGNNPEKPNPTMCTIWKLNDNDTEFKQLQHIFRTIKRNCKKKVFRGDGQFRKDLHSTSVEIHLKNIGQRLCRYYLQCFSREDQMSYNQNDFVNIRKVVDFFLHYLIFERKYINSNQDFYIADLLYSIYEKISQHHFILKHHLRTSSEKNPENDPWPVTVYDQLTKFNMMVNSKIHKNYSGSSTKLRQTSSTHSEHSIKYFAIDYFLKLLKIIYIETKDNEVKVIQKDVSGRATASSFNSHHYCNVQSGAKLSLPSLVLNTYANTRESPIQKTFCVGEYDKYSTDTGEETNKTTLEQWNKKHKKLKKRKIHRSHIVKTMKESSSSKKLLLSKFEINRAMISNTVKKLSKCSSSTENFRDTNYRIDPNPLSETVDTNNTMENVRTDCPIKTNTSVNEISSRLSSSKPQKSNDDSELVKEVSQIVGTIMSQQSKNVNMDEIKEQINAILTRNMQMEAMDKKLMEKRTSLVEKNECNVKEEHNKTPSAKVNQERSKEMQNIKSHRALNQHQTFIRNQSAILQHSKFDIHGLESEEEIRSEQYHPLENYSPRTDERGSKVKLTDKGSALIPVNMMKNPSGLRNISSLKGTNEMNQEEKEKIFEKIIQSYIRNENDRSGSCENRRNKVISNKINQKIMQLTGNVSMDHHQRPLVNLHNKSSENLSKQSEPTQQSSKSTKTPPPPKTSKEAIEQEQKEAATTPMANLKTSVISNDDLYFTNRRKLGIFKRPFHSLLGFESDLLSDVKASDEDFSIHELYFKKPYHQHESNSFTDQLNHESVGRVENPRQKRTPTQLGSKVKNLTKKQVEVFDKLRTMFKDEQTNPILKHQSHPRTEDYQGKMNDDFCDLDTYMSQLVADLNMHKRDATRGSRSQSCLYDSTPILSSKLCRSSETIQGML